MLSIKIHRTKAISFNFMVSPNPKSQEKEKNESCLLEKILFTKKKKKRKKTTSEDIFMTLQSLPDQIRKPQTQCLGLDMNAKHPPTRSWTTVSAIQAPSLAVHREFHCSFCRL